MTFPSTDLHINILFYLLKERWLRYWIETRLENILNGDSINYPMDFEEWWKSLNGLQLPFNVDYNA